MAKKGACLVPFCVYIITPNGGRYSAMREFAIHIPREVAGTMRHRRRGEMTIGRTGRCSMSTGVPTGTSTT